MTATDYAFLVVCVLALATMLAASKVLRTVVWECVRHPFQPSRIETNQGQIVITRSQTRPNEASQTQSPAGNR